MSEGKGAEREKNEERGKKKERKKVREREGEWELFHFNFIVYFLGN